MEGKELRSKLKPIIPEVVTLKEVFTFENVDDDFKSLDYLFELGKENPALEILEELKKSIQPEAMATIIYTSVSYTHLDVYKRQR